MKKVKIEKGILKNIIITVFAFFATYFLPYVINFEDELTFSNSIMSVIVFVSFIVLLKKTLIKENLLKIKNVCFLGIIFSTFLVLGNAIDTNGTVEYGNIRNIFSNYIHIIYNRCIISTVI